MKCPCCGGDTDPADLLIDLNTNTVSFRDECRSVTPQAAELLEILKEKFPATARMEWIIKRMIGLRDLKNPEGLVRQVVTRARQTCSEMGFEIQNIHGTGYRLVIQNPKLDRPPLRLVQ